METDGDQSQQGASANGSAAPGAGSRPSPMNSMSLYERQAVQALQALQRQPNAAQYFQQLMLQQQINNAQLHNLAAVQQATLAASRQSSPSSSTSSQSTSTTATAANVTTSGGASTRPIGQGASTTSTISQSVLLSGTAGGQGQMYLRVNRSLRAPISSQLIFMPGSTATAAVAVAQQPPQAQQQQEVTPASSSSGQSDNDQVQNLAMRGVSVPKGVGVKTEAPEKSDSAAYSLIQPTPQSPTKPAQPQLPHIKIPTYPQPSNLKPHHHHHHHHTSSTTSASSIPLSQLLLHGPRALTAATTAAGTATTTHILVPASSAVSQSHGYHPVGTATVKPGVGAQTLVVQPLQKASLGDKSAHHANGPVPIQPKTLQGLRLPLQLPSRNPPPILPAPPPPSSGGNGGGGSSQAPPPQQQQQQQQPHIPVQIVGARQSSLGVNGQALALAQARIDAAAATAGGGVPVSTAYSSVLSSSSSLLTMVASIASREAAASAAGRAPALKGLQEAPPLPSPAQVSHVVHPQANQNAAVGQAQQNGTLGSSHTSSSSSSSQSPTVTAPPAPLSSSLSRASLTLPLVAVVEEQRGGASAVANGESVTSQGKQMTGSLKRKLESNSTNGEDGPTAPQLQPIRDHPSVLSSNAIEAGPCVAPPSPPLSPGLAVARLGGGHTERAPPPQAVVKPHVLTHLIEGFVIQEGAEPFPVCGPVKEPTGEDLTDSPDTNQSESVTPATVLKCEYCKKLAPAGQFRGTKRFCSMTCAKRYNVSCSQHFRMRQSQAHGQDQAQGHHHHHHHHQQHHHHLSASDEEGGGGGGGGGVVRRRVPRRTSSEIASAKIAGRPIPVKCRSESSHSDEASSGEEEEDDPMSFSPASSMASCHHQPPPPPVLSEGSAPSFLPSSPAQWSVEEVSQFISSLQGCEEIASQFLSQEIDGQALLLLKEEHLMSTMNIKLGPALKICAHINSLRD